MTYNEFGSYFDAPLFNEFLVPVKTSVSEVKNLLKKEGFIVLDPSRWYPELENVLLLAFTEMNTEIEIMSLIEVLKPYVRSVSF
jgi:hypothetical protein